MRTKLMTVATILLAYVATIHAADKSPTQILGGKPAVMSTKSGTYYDGRGAYSGRATTSGKSTRFYDGRGNYVGSNAK